MQVVDAVQPVRPVTVVRRQAGDQGLRSPRTRVVQSVWRSSAGL